jgi:hypothetical protein
LTGSGARPRTRLVPPRDILLADAPKGSGAAEAEILPPPGARLGVRRDGGRVPARAHAAGLVPLAFEGPRPAAADRRIRSTTSRQPEESRSRRPHASADYNQFLVASLLRAGCAGPTLQSVTVSCLFLQVIALSDMCAGAGASIIPLALVATTAPSRPRTVGLDSRLVVPTFGKAWRFAPKTALHLSGRPAAPCRYH